jgi:hypothetical protein
MGHRAAQRFSKTQIRVFAAIAGSVLGTGVALGAATHFHGSAGGDPAIGPTSAQAAGAVQSTTQSASASASASPSPSAPASSSPAPDPVTPLPAGVVLQQIDGGPGYFGKWQNGFPASASFLPIGVYPSQASPSQLAAEGINFFTPMRNETAGTWCPVWNNPNGNDMSGVDAQPGFYAGGTFYQSSGKAWGQRAAFDVFGDELDGNAANWFDCLPSSISSHNQSAGGGAGLSASAYEAAEAASHAADSSRPLYIQTTVTFMDGGKDYFYTGADKAAICTGADIFSFDMYPLVMRDGHVWNMYDQIQEARGYCRDSRPVMAFTEMDHMDNGSIYPQPEQTSAEAWNAIIGGARGIQYFDQYSNIAETGYNGAGHYASGAMYKSIRTTNAQITALAPVINAPFAEKYVSASGSMSVMAKYYNGHFYVFAIPHASGSQTVTFTLAGAPTGTLSVLNEDRSVSVSGGKFTDSFANEDVVHVYELG